MRIIKNKRNLVIAVVIVLIIIILFLFWPKASVSTEGAKESNAFSAIASKNLTTNGNSVVSWAEAISILRSGEVRQVSQLPNLEITIEMNNGDQITTTEPVIDEVIEELKLCGKVCENIVIATE